MRLPKRKTAYELISCAAVLLMAAGLLIIPEESVEAAKNGLKLCANVIIPSLFPFFVLSGMLVELDAARYLGILFEKLMRPLFNLGGSCAVPLVLGFLGGYPTGARTAIAIYEKGLCSKEEAERLLAFCNNSGPAFILGVVGAGIFSSSRAGIILYLSHTLASIIIGVGFRFYKRGAPTVDARAAF
jgi:sporulation integral membrane protein YlbJ